MFHSIKRRISIELSHYRALHKDTRHLLLSYFLYLMSYPLIATFMDAYLWRTSGGIWWVIIYNLGYITGLPIGFYLNGFLLRKIHVLRLYFIGAVLQGITALSVVFLATKTVQDIGMFGLLYGVGGGLYWANKNYLSLKLTRGTNKVYYNSIESSVDLMINIVVPVLAGWFIAFGDHTEWYAHELSYKVVMVVGLLCTILAGGVLQSSTIRNETVYGLVVKHVTRRWWIVRLFHILYNLQVGIALAMGSVLILTLIGGEGVLGTLQAVTAGLSAFMLYVIGRKTSLRHSWMFVAVGAVIFVLASGFLASWFTWFGAFVYTLAFTIVYVLQWPSSYSVVMEVMEQEADGPADQYAYVCDNELFFNIGRLGGILIVIGLLVAFSQNTALRWSPLIIACIQLFMIWPIKMLGEMVTAEKK